MRTAMLSRVALLAVVGLLLGASGASAAPVEPDLVSGFLLWLGESGGGEGGGAGVGGVEDNRPFIEPLDAYCESGCCWAACVGVPGHVECSETSCSASCNDGSSAKYTCNAT